MTKETDDALHLLKMERKMLVEQLKTYNDTQKEQTLIKNLNRQLKDKKKQKSKFRQTIKALGELKNQAERMTHPERFKDNGHGERRKGKSEQKC